MDKNIIPLPLPVRFMLAKWISVRRSKREAGDSYGLLGNRSPLLENTQSQAEALEKFLGDEKADYKVFVSMRYWNPMAKEVVRQVRDWGADEVFLLPLYPQFSTTTTRSSLQTWRKAMRETGYQAPVSGICCYPLNTGFIKASADSIKAQIAAARKDGHGNIRILFSAHGLPESVIKDGDPYQWQCEQTAQKIAAQLGVEDWAICYQSRVGPKKWIEPSLEEELERAAHDRTCVVIYPHSFTQEHVETLVELDIEYRHKAEALGVPGYYRAAAVSMHPDFIAGLKNLVLAQAGSGRIAAEGQKMICPAGFRRCCMRAREGV